LLKTLPLLSRPVENGSVMGPLHSVSDYAVQIIKKMQNENIRSWVPDQTKTDQFNDHVQEWIKHTVWKDDCRSCTPHIIYARPPLPLRY